MMLRDKIAKGMRAFILGTIVLLGFGAAGEVCGVFFERTDAVFGNKFPDNKPEDIREVMSLMEASRDASISPANASKLPIAVVVVKGDPRAVVGVDLDSGKQLWRIDAAVSSDPTLSSDFVFFKSGKRVVAHRILTGELAWSFALDEGWDYFGADSDGRLAALAIGVGGLEPGGYANAKLVALNASNGARLWEHGVGSGLLGNPVVIGSLIFAPWDRQKIVVVDAYEEQEICRVRAEDYSINFLRKGAGGVYAGSSASKNLMPSIYRFNESSANARREGVTSFMPELEPVPGVAHFGRDTFSRTQGGRSTEEKIRFHWHPAPSPESRIALDGDQFFLHYWRYVIAFDAKTSMVNWAYISPVILESVAAIGGGDIIVADTNGRLALIDGKTGVETWNMEIGHEVLTAVFDADGFQKKGGQEAAPPEQSLLRLIEDKDNRMLPIRAYCTALLGKIPKPEVTRYLLDVYSDVNAPPALKKAVVRAVEQRTIGSEHMIEALGKTYDYLEKTAPPPMKVVAPTLINMDAKQAVPKLIEHLTHHETPIDNLPYILAALYKLGDASVVEPIRRFLTMYHADSSFTKHEQVLASAAHTLLKFGEKEPSEAFIAAIRDDSQTLLDLKILLKKVLDPKKTAKEEAAMKAREEAKRIAAAKAERIAKEAAIVPDSLSREQIHETVKEHQELFKPCIMEARRRAPDLEVVRMRFVLNGETGIVSDVRVLPDDIEGLRECLREAFELIQFRRFKLHQQTSTYTIRIEPEKKTETMDMVEESPI